MTTTTIDDELGEEWLTADTKMSRWRAALILAFAASLIFLGGIQTQKWLGTSTSSSASGLPSGFPTGGLPAGLGGGFGGGTGTGTGGTTPGGSTGTGSGTSSASAVIGTVVSVTGDVWTVKDIGGATHKVTVTATIPIRQETSVAATAVKSGQSVTVDGTKNSAGDVTATKITVR